MQIAIVKTTISRDKLEQGIYEPDNNEIVGYEEVDEDRYYQPMFELLRPRFLKWLEEVDRYRDNQYRKGGEEHV